MFTELLEVFFFATLAVGNTIEKMSVKKRQYIFKTLMKNITLLYMYVFPFQVSYEELCLEKSHIFS